MAPEVIRMLYFTREEFPTHRVDIDVLFGRELAGRGNAIDFVMQAASDSVAVSPQSWCGRTIFVGPTRSANSLLSRFVKQCLGFWHDLRSLKLASPDTYDAIQVRDKFLIAAIALVAAHIRGLKFFFWLSFPFPEDDMLRAREGNSRSSILVYMRGMFSGWLLYRWILPKCDHAFVQSQQMRKDVCKHGINSAKVTAVPMGIATSDVDAFVSDVIPKKRSFESVTLAYLGTLNSGRHLEILVEMLALLRQQDLDVKLLLIGDGDLPGDRLRLERRAGELCVRDHMEITGFLLRADALARMRIADIALSPFFPTPVLRSTSPTKLVEYMALGLPVVANDHPEQSLVLRESRAGVCVPWGARYFARAVRWLMKNSQDQRLVMGEQGRAWVRANRTYLQIANNVEAKYFELLGKAKSGPAAQY